MLKNIFKTQKRNQARDKWTARTWLFTTTLLRRVVVQTTEEYHEELFERDFY